jgi:hypothetical protein
MTPGMAASIASRACSEQTNITRYTVVILAGAGGAGPGVPGRVRLAQARPCRSHQGCWVCLAIAVACRLPPAMGTVIARENRRTRWACALGGVTTR